MPARSQSILPTRRAGAQLALTFAMSSFIASPLVEGVIGCAIDVHRALGPGLLESAYDRCLAHELSLRSIAYRRQIPLPVVYKGIDLDCGYRVDYVIEGQLLLEIKAVDRLLPIHQAQLLTYLRLLRLRQGLLMNFNVALMTHGIKSMLNGVPTEGNTAETRGEAVQKPAGVEMVSTTTGGGLETSDASRGPSQGGDSTRDSTRVSS
jgi:GxxExxY protein